MLSQGSLQTEEGRSVRKKFEDATLLVLKLREGTISHARMQEASRNWKRQGSRLQKEYDPANTLILAH